MEKLVHKHNGVGQLEVDGTESRSIVTYAINEYVDVISAASFDDPSATIEGPGSFKGIINTRDGSRLPFEPHPLTLHLGDGRRLNVVLSNVTGA